MNIKEKLLLIQKISGVTQEEMAHKLGVTFASLNRWINEKSKPRAKMLEKIERMYMEYSGQTRVSDAEIETKKKDILIVQKAHPDVIREIISNPDVKDQFYLSLTYNTNRIEGSSLTEGETAEILFENAALKNKSLAEQLEAKNHQAALIYLFEHISHGEINEQFILKLHSILLNAVRSDAGTYRKHSVRILGTDVPTANFLKIPDLIKQLILDINKNETDIFTQIAATHARFEQIHPFGDGNGRIGRLLMHAMALKRNFPPMVIYQSKKIIYKNRLYSAQMNNDLLPLAGLICDATLEGYRILERKW
ncbi:MAG: Filamentation induced by cAMP protein Fic [Candidatus Giovannonibacteria bacterium GW2011_GWC2_44_9]|uniref:Filamentation induced by cAMP protein Fic n=4 Tax=Patescibacteria group TaxID=1783273 RepID=A0A0G1LSB6_9BACT|nr:MAG: Filamentation induced by cAMP protein Fic [Candidatus Gottesmanbacteria bacterium GW2011_GWB1_44_11c]KKT62649.1 MAG: Filamentation induced by cAMP protein Fic [Candidatus Giovannonibacteria bacterium GW2011_GWA1_44_29]KKT82883.1 MAG: Filamentation induced by cAMP protein Fic [Candidatus Giovannonibacteria bacterium GW2011_GWC2_44_9]OGF75036.1 MAG: hypothetical protein A3B05_03110 [Candidatus Giovannonibacteria bacterium RIFCSPLOWO2_01_FULL_43_160]OGN15084.1 MAG: hypothetical protein A3C